MNSNGGSGREGKYATNRSSSPNSKYDGSDAESEFIDMTSNDSCDSFDSYQMTHSKKDKMTPVLDAKTPGHEETACYKESHFKSEAESQLPVMSKFPDMAALAASNNPYGLAMSMFMANGAAPTAVPSKSTSFLDSLSEMHHHQSYLNALHQQQQQQQYLFNTSLKMAAAAGIVGGGNEPVVAGASAFHQVK